MYRLFLCFSIIIATTLSYGQQRALQVEDQSGAFDVFAGSGNEAGMVIICNEGIKLTFESNRDGTVNVFDTKLKGSDVYYYLRMPVGDAYDGRRLTIYTLDYAPLLIEPNLQVKELKTFRLYDPDKVIGGCYDQTMKEGLEVFRKGFYPEAKLKYIQVKECMDTPAAAFDEIDRRIAEIDTIINLRRRADNFFATGNYQSAYDHYLSVFAYNSDDRYVELRMTESRTRITGGAMENTAEKKQELTAEQIERRRQRTFVIAYERNISNAGESNNGGSLGWYRDKKVGACFAYQRYKSLDYFSEESASFGLTFRLFRMTKKDYRKWPWGVWMSVGGAYSVMSVYDSYYYGYGDSNFKSFAPEAGLLMKMGFLVMKATYRYRINVPNEWNQGVFWGIGICF